MANSEQILRTASALFLEKGCKALTMDEIASANGMSKRTLYEMFHDKAQLLQECILLMHKDNMARSERDLAMADNVLEWFLHSLSSNDPNNMSFYYGLFSEVKKYYPDVFMNVVRDVNSWHRMLLERIITRGQQEGLFLSGIVDAGRLSLQLFELSVAVADSAVRNYLEIRHDDSSTCLMLLLIRGISSEKGIAYIDKYLENNKSLLQ